MVEQVTRGRALSPAPSRGRSIGSRGVYVRVVIIQCERPHDSRQVGILNRDPTPRLSRRLAAVAPGPLPEVRPSASRFSWPRVRLERAVQGHEPEFDISTAGSSAPGAGGPGEGLVDSPDLGTLCRRARSGRQFQNRSVKVVALSRFEPTDRPAFGAIMGPILNILTSEVFSRRLSSDDILAKVHAVECN
jgi:hypothetical protein